jgi:DNA-binding NtrC family response regulator
VPPETRLDAPLVLIVDDEQSARDVCERRLLQAGYRVIGVANSLAAKEVLLQIATVAAVIADRRLEPGRDGRPAGDGLVLLEQVGRSRPRVARLLWPADPGDCGLAAERGVRCVEKTGHYTELLTALAEELRRAQRGAA